MLRLGGHLEPAVPRSGDGDLLHTHGHFVHLVAHVSSLLPELDPARKGARHLAPHHLAQGTLHRQPLPLAFVHKLRPRLKALVHCLLEHLHQNALHDQVAPRLLSCLSCAFCGGLFPDGVPHLPRANQLPLGHARQRALEQILQRDLLLHHFVPPSEGCSHLPLHHLAQSTFHQVALLSHLSSVVGPTVKCANDSGIEHAPRKSFETVAQRDSLSHKFKPALPACDQILQAHSC